MDLLWFFVLSPTPIKSDLTQMSSSILSQCNPVPPPLMIYIFRCLAVACKSRGKYASGTESFLPSANSTHILSVSKLTLCAIGSVAKVFIPRLKRRKTYTLYTAIWPASCIPCLFKYTQHNCMSYLSYFTCTTISTLRFLALPWTVVLEDTGRASPQPTSRTIFGLRPRPIKYLTTARER